MNPDNGTDKLMEMSGQGRGHEVGAGGSHERSQGQGQGSSSGRETSMVVEVPKVMIVRSKEIRFIF